jgi:hypothetical protein
MLSRVASHLYWLSRYLERAENMARILDVGASLALLSRQGDERVATEPLVITDSLEAFNATGRSITPENVAHFLAWDTSYPSSIVNCLEASRENARAVRGSITSEMWENINDTWLQFSAKRRDGKEPVDAAFFDWVKERSHLFRGVTFGTMLRGEAYHFLVSISPETHAKNTEEYEKTITTSPIKDWHYKAQTLHVTFNDGSIYEYFSVPSNVYNKFIKADGNARFARRHIFSVFTYRRIGGPVEA